MNNLASHILSIGLEAEQQLLACLLQHPSLLPPVVPRLSSADFGSPPHRLIWQSLVNLHSAGLPVDPAVLRDHLSARNSEKTAELSRLLKILGALPAHPESLDAYVRLVLQSSRQRHFAALGLSIYLKSINGDQTLPLADEVQQLVDAALQQHKSVSASARLTARDLCARSWSSPRWLLDRVFLQGGVNLLAGEISSGKTFLALDLALAVASGSPAWGGRAVTPGSVLYYCLDSSPRTLQDRLALLCKGRGIDPPSNLEFEFGSLNLGMPASLVRLQHVLKRSSPVLVVFDVLARYIPGVDENSVADIGPIMTGLRNLASQSGSAILLIHHFNKGVGYSARASSGLRIRGSSDILAAVDCAVSATVVGSRRFPRRTLTPEKNRECPEEPPQNFTFTTTPEKGMQIEFTLAADQSPASGLNAAVDSALQVLSLSSGQALSRSELIQKLSPLMRAADPNLHLNEYISRGLFIELSKHPSVSVSRAGSAKKYSWLPA